MAESVKVHITFTSGPFHDPDAPLAGESPWAEPLGNNLYRIDNLLFVTFEIGYRDVVRCADSGTGWEGREVVEVVTGYPCWRGLVALNSPNPSARRQLLDALNERYGDDIDVEFGFGAAIVQCEPSVGPALDLYLKSNPQVEDYTLVPVNTQSPAERN